MVYEYFLDIIVKLPSAAYIVGSQRAFAIEGSGNSNSAGGMGSDRHYISRRKPFRDREAIAPKGVVCYIEADARQPHVIHDSHVSPSFVNEGVFPPFQT